MGFKTHLVSIIYLLIILIFINDAVCVDLPTCKTCIVTGEGSVDKSVKFGWEDEQ
eukprot:jgi/Orpsp1_1/1181716/evm.model.c7180000078290.1